MASYRQKNGVWFYRYVDGTGHQRERKGRIDLVTTKLMAGKAESEASKVRNNLIDPAELAFSIHESRPLEGHLADWHLYLTAKGSTPQHALLSRNRAYRIIELARVERLSELAPSRIQAALKAIRDTEISLRSIHHYTRAIKGFSRWLWRDGRAARSDVLAHLTSQNPDSDRRHDRRALTEKELVAMVPPNPARLSTRFPDLTAPCFTAWPPRRGFAPTNFDP